MRNSDHALQTDSGEDEPSIGEGGHVFTDYVRSLGPRGEPPTLASFQRLQHALRTALVRELKRRGLWESPPSYLGIFGHESWSSGPGREGALDELLAAAYTFNFVTRLRALEAQLRVKPNIDGLVLRNLRNLLHERQKQHDPLGSHLFEVLCTAVREAVAAGELRIVSGDLRVRNDTILEAPPSRALVTAGEAAVAASEPDPARLESMASAWCSDLLPDLVTARGRRREELIDALRRRFGELPREGIGSFGFKELLDTLKANVRSRWAALFEQSAGHVGLEPGEEGLETVVQLCRPEAPADRRLEARQIFRRLVNCVSDALDRLVIKERTRRYLSDLWQFLRLHAAGPDNGESPVLPSVQAAAIADRLPSQRKLAELLEIPRDRLPELYTLLGGILRRCQRAVSGPGTVTPLEAKRPRTSKPRHEDER